MIKDTITLPQPVPVPASRQAKALNVLKILQCTNFGGMEQTAYTLLDRLSRDEDARFRVITPRPFGPGKERITAIDPQARDFHYRGKFGWRSFPSFRKQLKAIAEHTDTIWLTGTCATSVAAIRDLPQRKILGHHYHHFEKPTSRLQWAGFYQLLCRNLDLITYPTDFTRNEAISIAPWIKQKSMVVRNGFLAQYQGEENRIALQQAARQKLDLPQDAFIIGNAGWLIPRKRFDIFLHTAQRVAELNSAAYFVICGGGALEANLKDLAARLGIADRVRFTGWIEDLVPYYQAWDVCLFNSDFDTLPCACIEPATHGCVVVASLSYGGLGEFFHSGENGILIGEHNPNVLASHIQSLAAHPHVAVEFRHAATELLRTEYALEKSVAFYRTALEDPSLHKSSSFHIFSQKHTGEPRHNSRPENRMMQLTTQPGLTTPPQLNVLKIMQCTNLGGMEQTAYALLDELSQAGKFRIVTPRSFGPGRKRLTAIDSEAVDFVYRGKFGWRNFLAFKKHVAALIDGIETVWLTGTCACSLAAIKQSPAKKILGHHFHHFDRATSRAQWFAFYNLLCRDLDVITYPTDFTRNEAISIAPWIRQKSAVVRNGFILHYTEEETRLALQREARKKLDLPQSAFIIGNAGWLIPRKRFDVFLHTARRVVELNSSAYFVICGGGILEHKLKALAARLGIADRVRFTGWISDLVPYYQAWDVCLFNSDFDALGRAPMEATSHGCLVVASVKYGGLQEFYQTGTNGILLTSHDTDRLAKSIQELAISPRMALEFRQGAMQKLGEEYSMKQSVDFYREALRRN